MNIEQLAEEFANKNSIYDTAFDDTYHGFIGRFSAAEKENNKLIKDLYNKYNSWLQEAKKRKLGKIVDEFKIIELESKVELLKEMVK